MTDEKSLRKELRELELKFFPEEAKDDVKMEMLWKAYVDYPLDKLNEGAKLLRLALIKHRRIKAQLLYSKLGLNQRADGRVEWMCEHGTGHTIAVPHEHEQSDAWWSHGCCGYACCNSETFKQLKAKLEAEKKTR